MAKPPDISRTKARKGKRASGAGVEPSAAALTQAAGTGGGWPAKVGKSARTGRAPVETTDGAVKEPARKSARKSAGKSTRKSAKRPKANETVTPATPVVIRAAPADAAAPLPAVAVSGKAAGKSIGKTVGKGAARRPPRQTFLVAATLTEGGVPRLGVYAAVTRTPGEALAAVRALLGAEIPVGLTGKLSGRMARALGLKPGEVRRI